MSCLIRRALILLYVLCAYAQAQEKINFQEQVQPIFREHCSACHSADNKSSDLALDTFAAALAGGAGGKLLAPGDPAGSRLWRLVNHDEEPAMPPGKKLPDEQLAVIKEWIETGLLENNGSQPMAAVKPVLAAVAVDASGRPAGEPAIPTGVSREPVLVTPKAGPVLAVSGSPWAPLVALAGERQAVLYHTRSAALLGVLPFPEGTVQVLRFRRDGAVLLIAGGENAVLGIAALYDVKSGERLLTVGDELDTVLAADLSPDGTLVALGGPRKRVRAYRTADGSLAYEIAKHTEWVTALAFSPDGKLLASADRAGGLFTWDAPSGNPRGELRGHTERIAAIDWRADSQALASVGEDDTLRLWKPDGAAIRSSPAHGGGALGVAFAPDGRLATTGREALAKLWQADGTPQSTLPKLPGIGLAVAFADEGRQLVASTFPGVAVLFDAAGKETAKLTANPPTIAMRIATVEQELGKQMSAANQAQQALVETRKRTGEAKGKPEFDKFAEEATKLSTVAAEALDKAAEQQRELAGLLSEQSAAEARTAHLAAAVAERQAQVVAAESAVKTASEGLAAAENRAQQLAEQLAKLQAELKTAQETVAATKEAARVASTELAADQSTAARAVMQHTLEGEVQKVRAEFNKQER